MEKYNNASVNDIIRYLDCDTSKSIIKLDTIDTISKNMLLQVPKINDNGFCELGLGCSNNCSSQGICLTALNNSKCFCNGGYFGTDCAFSSNPYCTNNKFTANFYDFGYDGWDYARFQITDSSGLVVGGALDSLCSGSFESNDFCLPYGCYKMVVSDSYGDGFEGGTFCQEDGSLDIVYNSISLGSIPTTSPDFGDQTEIDFCITEDGVGIENLSENSILVYPNPAKNLLNIQVGNSLKGFVNFTDISGKLIFTKEITQSQTQFALEQLSAGTYFLQFNLEGQILVKKLIIE
jgi:hypothetical protein